MFNDEEGQASIEGLLLLAAVIIAVTSLQFMGRSSNEATVATTVARDGAEMALNRLVMENGIDMKVSSLNFEDNKIVLTIRVYSSSTLDNVFRSKIKSTVEEAARMHLLSAGVDYEVSVENIKRVVK